jgi:hypothetical protein
MSEYAKSFALKWGFWRPKKGCLLPYRLRSVVCATHNCLYDNDDEAHDEDLKMSRFLTSIRDVLRDREIKE